MRVYLDNCCYNRPFDPQTDLRISLETAAKMRVQALMRSGDVEYATWHQRHFNNGETVRELGEKIKAYAKTRKAGA